MVKRGIRIAVIGAGVLALALMAAITRRERAGVDARLLPLLERFHVAPEFSLSDSLPALSGGLTGLEAFRLSLPGVPANADRSLWISDSLRGISFEYFSARSPFDSTRLHLWTSDSLALSRTVRRAGSERWDIHPAKRIGDWVEIVGVYVSYPGFMTVKTKDPEVSVFERVEGSTLHVIRGRYCPRREKPAAPDTAYPAAPGELNLLARGNTLAVLNGSSRAVRLRLLQVSHPRGSICEVPPGAVHVYRNLLKDSRGPLLAHTEAGRPFRALFRSAPPKPEYFWLERKASSHPRREPSE